MMTSPQGAFGDYQLEIYGAGLRGVLPTFPMAFAELGGQGGANPVAFGAVLRGRWRGQRVHPAGQRRARSGSGA